MLRKKKNRIGIVGCGAIGSYLAKEIDANFGDKANLCGLFDISLDKAYALSSALGKKKIAAISLEDLVKRCDLVIEAASASVVREVVKSSILAKKDCLVMSVGGLIDSKALFEQARARGCRIYIPSGAIAGIDAIKAASLSKIEKIILTTRKPPSAFIGVAYVLKRNINLEHIETETSIFEGDVDTALRLFPQNINVAATLSLASRDKKKITVRIITSPEYKNNIHEIEIFAESGKIFTRTENVAFADNPKTSFLAALSAVAALKNILEAVKVGT
ncbi:MAG: aspartate dehydrogenase [Candidatus Omnitrophota bacterium]|nr:aspartate dehydrogenase [Candidatus Omnitrophota bacterium]